MRTFLAVVFLTTAFVLNTAAQNTNRWTQPACSGGGKDHVIFSNPNSGCLCEAKGRAPTGYVECRTSNLFPSSERA